MLNKKNKNKQTKIICSGGWVGEFKEQRSVFPRCPNLTVTSRQRELILIKSIDQSKSRHII